MPARPSEIAQRIYESKIKLTRAYGCNYADGREITPRFIVMVITVIFEQFMHFYGLYQVWPSIPLVCDSLGVYCLIFQLLVRLGSKFIKHDTQRIASLLNKIVTFYEREERNHEHRAVLYSNIKAIEHLTNVYVMVCFAIFSIPNPTVWMVSWYSNDFMLIFPMHMPNVDVHTLTGYLITTVLLVYYTILCTICYAATDVFYIFFILQCIPMTSAYTMKWKKFGEDLIEVKTEKKSAVSQPEPSTSRGLVNIKTKKQLEEDDEKAKEEIEEVEKQMIDLIKDFNSFDEYLKSAIEFMELTTFASVIMNSVSIAMAIIVILTYSKAVGGVMVIFLTFQAFIPCILGTVILHQKQRLLDKLYSFPWYELSLSKQKIFLQLLHLVQNSSNLSVPIMGQIDMEIFTNMMNAAYTYFMYLHKFAKL